MVEEGEDRSVLSCSGEKLLMDIKKVFFFKKDILFYAIVFSMHRVL